jgi:hypothetical protein
MAKPQNLVGRKFGRLTAVKDVGKNKWGSSGEKNGYG